ncbi:hypothetical protein [Methanobrevibacter sp.]|uniref:hypothetical protein n=1 Tax=Methanobrevibacter sp. TaxID=66852 RepID=UPI00388F8FA6
MKPKQKVVLYLSLFFIAALSLVAYGFYAETTKVIEFEEFSVEVPVETEIENITNEYKSNYDFITVYRAKNIDLTISSFDKQYIENTYSSNTGEEIDFGKSVLENLNNFNNPKINKSSENITFYISNTRVDGQIDCDVAGVYNDDNHFIIVEGGDVELIEKITNSIKINDNYNN